MAFNRGVYQQTKEIKHGDAVIATVRAINPNDISRLVTEASADLEQLVGIFEDDASIRGLDLKDGAAVDAAVATHSSRLIVLAIQRVPMLVAKVLAIACDAPEAEAEIGALPLPVQTEMLHEIAVLTFVDGEGFRKFLGNAMALARFGSANRTSANDSQAKLSATPDTTG